MRIAGLGAGGCIAVGGRYRRYVDLAAVFSTSLRKQALQLTVLYILGNHEHWYLQWEQGLAEYRRLAADYDIRLLENESLIIDDVLFCGTTL